MLNKQLKTKTKYTKSRLLNSTALQVSNRRAHHALFHSVDCSRAVGTRGDPV